MSSVAYKLVYFLVVDAIVFVVTDGDGSAAGIVVSSLLAIFAVPYHADFAFFFLFSSCSCIYLLFFVISYAYARGRSLWQPRTSANLTCTMHA